MNVHGYIHCMIIYKPNIKCTGIIYYMYLRTCMYMLIYTIHDTELLLLLYSLIEPVVEVIGQGK